MYDGWRKNEAHSREWVDNSNKFIEHAFSLSNTGIMRCSCSKCQNGLSHDEKMFQYTFIGLVICQATRCGCTMARKSLKMNQ
jgi:hypothetical protein